MAEVTAQRLRGLIPSAVELREKHPDWDDAFTEDYLSIIESLVLLAEEVDTKNDILKTTTRVTTSPYTLLATDEEVYFDTDTIPIVALLPAGEDGRNYRMINTGSSLNDVTLTPDGTDLLFGVNATERIADGEVLIATFETDEGWY